MAITIRLTEEQELLLSEVMELTGQATKSKAILYMIENAKSIIKNDSSYRKIQRIEEEIEIKRKEIAKIKSNN